jgi:hypothetical protein
MRPCHRPRPANFVITLITLLAYLILEQPLKVHGQTTNATLSVTPYSQPVSPGNQATIEILVNPGGNQISGLSFRLWYESQLTNPQVSLGSVFESQVDFGGPVLGSNYIDVALVRSPGTIPYTGEQVTVATITFDSLPSALGTASLWFDPANSYIFDTGTVNVLSATYSGIVTFPCPPIGDMDGDNDIDLYEYTVVVNNFDCGLPDAPTCPPVGDMDGDGVIGGFEYALVVNNFECGSQSQSTTQRQDSREVYAAASADFSVIPPSQLVSPGGQVNVGVTMDPQGNAVSAFEFRLEFDRNKLIDPVITEGAVFDSQKVLSRGTGPGFARLVIGCDIPCNPYSGAEVTIATLTLDTPSSASGNADIAFSAGSYNYIYNDASLPQNVLGFTNPGTVTFSTSRIYLPIILKGS